MKVRLKQLLHAEHQQQMKFTGKASGPRPLPSSCFRCAGYQKLATALSLPDFISDGK